MHKSKEHHVYARRHMKKAKGDLDADVLVILELLQRWQFRKRIPALVLNVVYICNSSSTRASTCTPNSSMTAAATSTATATATADTTRTA
jgi:hypothetical protein